MDTFEIEVNRETGVTKLRKLSGNCIAYKFPREKMSSFLSKSKELDKCGVYLLLADSQEHKVYVGEAEPVAKRMKQHHQKPLFDWEAAIVFVGSGNMKWDKGVIRYLEHGLYMRLRQCPLYVLVNGNTPQKATVAHPDLCESVIENIEELVLFSGYPKLFVRQKPNSSRPLGKQKNESVPKKEKQGQKKDESLLDYKSCPYSSASLMGAVVLDLNDKGKLKEKDISYLLSEQATNELKMRGNRYLKISTGVANEGKDAKGINRFMANRKLKVGETTYLISNQLFPEGFGPIVKWISDFGYTLSQAIELCQKFNMPQRSKKDR